MRIDFMPRLQRSYESMCAQDEAIHVCHVCPGDRIQEFARVRSGGYIKQAYYPTLMTNPIDHTLWQNGINSGDIIMVPQTSGSYDPGDPKELAGYGDLKVSYGPNDMTLTMNDPDYVDNYPFYNGIKSRTDLIPFFRTSSQIHIFDLPATIKAKDPVADDLETEVEWVVTNTVVSSNLPSLHPSANIQDLFTCPVISVIPFNFFYGNTDIPTTEAEILAGNVATADHNATIDVPDFENDTDQLLWMAEPLTEPVKTKWFNTITNQGSIGATNTFIAPVVIGNWRLYKSGFAKTFSDPAPVEFRKS